LKTAIITGIGGQDGAYLARLLLREGYRVVGTTRALASFDDFRLKYLGISDQVIITRLNEVNVSAARDLIIQYQASEIYNLAAQSSVAHSFKEPFQTIEFNILSTLAWLQAIQDTSPQIRFYQATSSEMFGNIDPFKLPLKENVLFHPASPYGISKAAAHWLVINYRETYGLFGCNGILFNHESPLRGEGYVIKKTISHLVGLHRGTHKNRLRLGNLKIKRDWGYAPYFVEAMHLIMKQDTPDDYLICTGYVLSLEDLVHQVCLELDLKMEENVISDPALFRSNDLMIMYGDSGKAKSQLGWKYPLSTEDLIHTLIQDEIQFQIWKDQQYKQ
jgi:GDPmannose 4,6-dehydratase